MTTQKIDLTDAGVTKLVRQVISQDRAAGEGQTTYLRTLGAAVQAQLGAKPRLTGRQGRVKAIGQDEAMEALGEVHGRFYSLVLAELDPHADAKARNAQSAFARSSASALRGAIKAGLNPLEIVIPKLTKTWLRDWVRAHAPEPEAPTLDTATAAAQRLAHRLTMLLSPLSDAEKVAVLNAIRPEFLALEVPAVAAAPTGASVLPFERRRPAPERRVA